MGEKETKEPILSADFFKGQWEAMAKRRGSSPDAAVLEVISGCSAGTCPHCYASAVPGRGAEMPIKLASTILEGLSHANTPPREIWLTGGEPGLYHNLPEVSGAAFRLGFSVCIVTNGEPFADIETTRRVAPYVAGFEVTLRSTSPLIHGLMMDGFPPALFERAKQEWSTYGPVSEETLKNVFGTSELPAFFAAYAHYGKTMAALRNFEQLRRSGGNFDINLNHDVFNHASDCDGHGELYRIIAGLKKEGVLIDDVWLQVLAISGRAVASLKAQSPQICWLTPSLETVLGYVKDQEALRADGFKTQAVWIDQLPPTILQQLEGRGIKPADIPNYQPEATPAFDVRGNLRENVLYPN